MELRIGGARHEKKPRALQPQAGAGLFSRPGLAIPCRVAPQQSPTPFRQARQL